MSAPQRETLEREIKLRVGPGFVLPPLSGRPLHSRVFTSTYYDTNEYRLARHGITLRYRQEGVRGVWQLKLPANEARRELEFSGGRKMPPSAITDLLYAHLRGESLRPIAKLRTRRTGVRALELDEPIADVVVDSVAVLDGRKMLRRFSEVEIEQVGGHGAAVRRIEKRVRKAGAEDGDPRPKVFQALDLAWPTPPLVAAPGAPPVEHLKALVQLQADRLLQHDPGTRLGTDVEDVHQMRVATRRLRAALRAAGPMLAADWAESLRGELAWLGGALGAVRDLDVLSANLRAECATLRPSERRACARWIDALARERAEKRTELLRALTGERYLALLDRLEAAAASPVVTDAPVGLPDLARKADRALRGAVRARGLAGSDASLHRLRILGKRARYAAELAEAAIGTPAVRYLKQLQRWQ
ncbi:MAG TPA: CYTH and CHAD domain-containing protein, partial [Nitrospiria bacterium]|nr:CYTH and CHAD domain-containing protein [Nitrospiria bacterium]